MQHRKSNHQRSSYRLLGLVGNGQFGRVYCGIHRKTGQLVAVKYLHRHSLPTHAFLRELHCLLSLAHPNIVACHALEHTDEGRQLILEYCAGGTLRSHMLRPLSLHDILNLTSDVLHGLAHAHQQGVIHCDIKPENVLLSYQNGRWRAKISDFGIAKLIQDRPNQKGLGQTGSPAYMAPERFYAQYSPAADVYAVGVMLYELLVGQRPFSGSPTVLQSAHLNQPVPTAEQLIGPLQTILTKALEKLPARRYPTAAEMLADLQAIDPLSLSRPLPSDPVKPVSPVEHRPYIGKPVQSLTQSVRHLKPLPDRPEPPVLMACGAKLSILQQQKSAESRVLDSPIQELYPTQTDLMVSTQHTLWSGPNLASLTPQIRWQAKTMVTIGPRWVATVTDGTRQLTILQRDNPAAYPIAKRPLSPDIDIDQVLTVDPSHLAIVGHSRMPGTQLQLWNRRGMYLTSLKLGITLQQLTPTRQPYQWMTLDAHAPQTVILLSLKPLRMTRLLLEICPTVMLDLPWGYLFSNVAGNITLLDRDFHPIGSIQGPAGVTAITSQSPHELLVATWQNDTGDLYCLDLYDFDLDMIF